MLLDRGFPLYLYFYFYIRVVLCLLFELFNLEGVTLGNEVVKVLLETVLETEVFRSENVIRLIRSLRGFISKRVREFYIVRYFG